MTTAQSGFLLIADITGYTAYLNESELEHAQDSLRTLLNRDREIGDGKPGADLGNRSGAMRKLAGVKG